MKGKKMRHFEYKDLSTNANKFWKVSLESKKVIVTFGRIGIENPAQNEKKFASEEKAKKYVESKIREKTNKGYQEIN